MLKQGGSQSQMSLERLGVGRFLAVASLCLGMSGHALAGQTAAQNEAAKSKPNQQVGAQQEESVLIASRTASEETTPPSSSKDYELTITDDGEKLRPISQSSDYSPELATTSAEDVEEEMETEDANVHGNPIVVKPGKADAGKISDAGAAEPKTLPSEQASTSTASARRAAAAQATKISHEPVKFQNVLVGKATRHELITAWGQPKESSSSAEGDVLIFEKSPFQSIEVLLGAEDVVSSIKVALSSPLEVGPLSQQLGLDTVDSVLVTDELGTAVCRAYPERGVLFMIEPSTDVMPVDSSTEAPQQAHKVTQVAIQPIDARAFAYRAENRLQGPYEQNISDLKTAIALDPEFGRAYWLLARVYSAIGQADQADAAAAEACDIEPKNASFQLCRAMARQMLAEYDDAVLVVRAVLDREDLTEIDRAQALHQMGRLASLGDKEIAARAISFETRAIEIADKLGTSTDANERRAAKQLLVEAHVAIAEEVARQPFDDKSESLVQWLGRASGLAEDFIAKDGGSLELRLLIAQRALKAQSNLKPARDPSAWITEAEEAAQSLLAQSNDELWQQHIKWELGQAYIHALRIEHNRRETEAALKFSQLAIDNLAIGASSRQAVHASEQIVGQLYFQTGAVYAVHKLDHAKAVPWYDKAAPLLTNNRPASELYAPRREGEMLVSMGVSYWQTGNKVKALEITQKGVELVEAAVECGVLAKDTLAVPYGNLASIYEQMGESKNAAKYSELAKSVSSTEPQQQPQQPRVSRNKPSKPKEPRAAGRSRVHGHSRG